MTASAAFAYAHARIQARHAGRADDALFGQLETSRTLRHYLERARATALDRWTAALDPSATAHDVERTLRVVFRRYVGEVAEWAPERWRPSVRWVARLVDVPLIESGTSPGWMSDDAELATARAELASDEEGPLDVWLARFRELLPRTTPSRRRAVERLVSLIAEHRARLRGGDDAWRLRRELAVELTRLLRRHPEQPAAVFAHLALVALDLERLRAALVVRALFEEGSERSWA